MVAERLEPLLLRGLICTCAVVELEAGRGTSASEYESVLRERAGALVDVPMPDDVWTRAFAIQESLAAVSEHQGPSVVDVAIAVVADHHGLTVLHYDADFDAITRATGIPSEWVAGPGSADGPDDL